MHCTAGSPANATCSPWCFACAVPPLQNGYWKRWQLLKGGNAEGTLEWEETWWEASDWTGLKEMGAEKKGACACWKGEEGARHTSLGVLREQGVWEDRDGVVEGAIKPCRAGGPLKGE